MIKQQNIECIEGQHWSTFDVDRVVARRLYEITTELREIRARIPARTLFLIEALGYSVDFRTGEVTRAE